MISPKKSKAPTCVTVDLEGTIIDVESLHHQAHLKAASQFGVHLTLEQAVVTIKHFIGGPDEEVAKEIVGLSARKVEPSDVLAVKRIIFERQLEIIPTVPVREGVVEFLHWIVDTGTPVIIGTVTPRELVDKLISKTEHYCLLRSLPLVTRDDVKRPKPAPDVYIATANILGINPKSQIVIEDSTIGVMAAATSGSRVIAIPSFWDDLYKERLIAAGAYAVYRNWSDHDLYVTISQFLGILL